MAVNKLIIDGIDAYTEFGVCLAYGGATELVAFNSLKEPKFNSWPEEDGIEVDLSEPKLSKKEIVIGFSCNQEGGVEKFMGFLDENVYHTFEFISLGITKKLRLVSMPNRITIQPLKNFELSFIDDSYPFENYVREDLIPIPVPCKRIVEIDGIPLADYGILVTIGIEDEILTSPNVKQNLTIEPESINGDLYDYEADVVFESRDVQVPCHLRAPINAFWNNYNALFWDITRPGEHTFFYGPRNVEYPFYYKSCTVDNFDIVADEIWCDFTITIHFTHQRIGDLYKVLSVIPQGIIVLDDSGVMVNTAIN